MYEIFSLHTVEYFTKFFVLHIVEYWMEYYPFILLNIVWNEFHAYCWRLCEIFSLHIVKCWMKYFPSLLLNIVWNIFPAYCWILYEIFSLHNLEYCMKYCALYLHTDSDILAIHLYWPILHGDKCCFIGKLLQIHHS